MALGHMLLNQGDFESARSATEEGIGDYRTLPNANRGLSGALSLLSGIHYQRGDHEKAVAVIEEALAVTPLDDQFRLDELRGNLATNVAFAGDLERGRQLLSQSVVQRLRTVQGLASTHMLGVVEQMRGDYEQSARLINAALSALDPKVEVSSFPRFSISLALTELLRGDRAQAITLCTQGIDAAHGLGDRVCVVRGFDTMAIICTDLGNDERAARFLGAAAALEEKLGTATWVPLRRDLERARLLANGRLGATAFDAAFDAGAALPLKDVIALLREEALA
jgi:tetratricopeptide (TPR) repeat protein